LYHSILLLLTATFIATNFSPQNIFFIRPVLSYLAVATATATWQHCFLCPPPSQAAHEKRSAAVYDNKNKDQENISKIFQSVFGSDPDRETPSSETIPTVKSQ
jgi:hypothetical protein